MRETFARDGNMAISELHEVSERIKTLRNRAGLKQYEVAAKINVAPRTYQSWENGEVETSKENYGKVGDALGASANWILFGREEEPPLPTGDSPPAADADLRALVHQLLVNQTDMLQRLARIELRLEDQRTIRQPESRSESVGD